MTQDTKLGELLERARSRLAIDASGHALDRLDARLKDLAAELLLEWLTAERRFETQSQQSEYWLSRFYEEIHADEQPDATRIYERFEIGLPKAVYLSRLLRARRTAHWRQAARTELKEQLLGQANNARKLKEERIAHTTELDISLSSGAADEMRVLFDRVSDKAALDDRPRPPKERSRFGATRWFGVPADTLLVLLETIDGGSGS